MGKKVLSRPKRREDQSHISIAVDGGCAPRTVGIVVYQAYTAGGGEQAAHTRCGTILHQPRSMGSLNAELLGFESVYRWAVVR